jgi:all-trans-retinol 13,14-reductase
VLERGERAVDSVKDGLQALGLWVDVGQQGWRPTGQRAPRPDDSGTDDTGAEELTSFHATPGKQLSAARRQPEGARLLYESSTGDPSNGGVITVHAGGFQRMGGAAVTARRRRRRDVIVIGAGLAGLVCGAVLARRGMSVIVLEQHNLAGGYCTSWKRSVRHGGQRHRFVFDAGIHDISGLDDAGPVWRVLQRLGVSDRVQRLPVTHAYVVNGERFVLPHGRDALGAMLRGRFPRDATGIDELLQEIETIHGEVAAHRPGAGMVAMLGLRHTRRWLGVSWPAMVRTYVRDPQLRSLFLMPSGYLGHDLDAIDAVTMALVVGGYWLVGGVATAGGSQRLADALVRALRDAGGALRLRADVAGIRFSEGRVCGVALRSGEELDASFVVSNGSLDRTMLELVGAERLSSSTRQHALSLRPSTSAFAVFLALDINPDLPVMTLANGAVPISIAHPSAVDPSLAPAGCSSMTLMSLIPPEQAATWDRSAPDYRARRTAAGDELVRAAAALVPGLTEHVLYREDASPATFARYTRATGGAIYGMAPSAGVDVTTDIEGLFVCGASVSPGPGVEAVVRSGLRAADAIAPETAFIDGQEQVCAT